MERDEHGTVWFYGYTDRYPQAECPKCRAGSCVQQVMRTRTSALVVVHDSHRLN